ncbi:response regulator [Azospirillum sp. TSO22-1]|uniref:response regulator n=1 Tax=Azospirillum sp. TSO22-1 TaxID=716789 RepID=UPI000D658CD0|nr:response regulator [Azospirillum sp. TSO22-1]
MTVTTLLERSLDCFVVGRPNLLRAHGAAVLCVVLALAARLALDPFVANVVPFATFYPAILIATLAGGGRAGLSAWALSSVLAWYVFFPVRLTFNALTPSEATSLGLFAFTSLPVVWVAHRLRGVVAALHQSEERFRTLVEAMPKLVWTADGAGRVDYLNRQWIEFTGVPAGRHLGDGWLEAVHPDDRGRVRAAWAATVAGQGDYDLEYRLRRHDGEYRWFKVRGLPIRDSLGRPTRWIGSLAEITEIQEARQALARSRDELERLVAERTRELADSNRLLLAESAERERAEAQLARAQRLEAIGQLTGGVAHDFNNLLTVIVGNLDMVERAADDPERVRRLVGGALAAAGRGERLTQQLLAFARRQPLRPEVAGVNRLVRELEPLIRRAVGEAVEVTLDLGDDLRPCRVDTSQFEAAVLNLVVNARDATPPGGRITVSTRGLALPAPDAPSGLADGDWLVVAVRDTGSGISPDVLPRVFDPFFTTKDVGKGSGLGLSQVYGFVRQSGGQVRLESAPGTGTTVQIWLPAAAGAEEPAVAPPPEESGDALAGAGETVLVAEDDPDVRTVAVDTLQALGYRVLTAQDGVEALEVLEAADGIALLFTDVVMPRGVNGADLARRTQALRPGLRVLLTSGYTAQALTSEHGVVHGYPLLRKPYRGVELARAVRAALGTRAEQPAPPPPSGAAPPRVFIVEDDELIRLSTLELLADVGAKVVGEAADAETALQRLDALGEVDVLFTDMRLPGMSGAELARAARRRWPALRVVLATGYGDMVEGFDASAPGSAILAKPYGGAELRRLLDRLRAVEPV